MLCCVVWFGLACFGYLGVFIAVAAAPSKLAVVAWSGSRQSAPVCMAKGLELPFLLFLSPPRTKTGRRTPDLYAYILRVACAVL